MNPAPFTARPARLACVWCLLITAAPAPAQPAEVSAALRSAAEAYSSRPVAERVRISVRPAPPGRAGDTITVRIDPGDDPAHAPRAIAVSLGDLRIHASEGEITCLHARNARSYFTAPYRPPLSAPSLASAVPPVPLPQLALAAAGRRLSGDEPASAADEAQVWSDLRLTPLVGSLRWLSAEQDQRAGQITLTADVLPPAGQRAAGTPTRLSMTVAASSGRLVRLVHELDAFTLTLDFTYIAPGDPGAWKPALAGRSPVSSITDLAPPGETAVAIGDAVGQLRLQRLDDRVWNLEEHIAAADEPVLLAFSRDPAHVDSAPAGLDAFDAVVARLRAAGVAVDAHVVFVADLADPASAGGVAAAALTWAEPRTHDRPDGPPTLLWSASPRSTADRFDPGSPLFIVAIDLGGVLRAVAPLDGESIGAIDGLTRDIRRALAVGE